MLACPQMKTLLHGNAVIGHTGHSQIYYPGTHRKQKKPSQRKAHKPAYYDIYMVVIIISFHSEGLLKVGGRVIFY